MASYTFIYNPSRSLIPLERVCFLCGDEYPDMICERQPDEKTSDLMTAYAHDKCLAEYFAAAGTTFKRVVIEDKSE